MVAGFTGLGFSGLGFLGPGLTGGIGVGIAGGGTSSITVGIFGVGNGMSSEFVFCFFVGGGTAGIGTGMPESGMAGMSTCGNWGNEPRWAIILVLGIGAGGQGLRK